MAAVITTSSGIKLSIAPLISDTNAFLSCTIDEAVGGDMVKMTVRMATDRDPCSVLDTMSVKLVNDTGWAFKFKAYVYELSYAEGSATVKMYGCSPQFLRTVKTDVFYGMDEAISSVWDGDVDKNAEADTPVGLRLYQKNESGYSFLKRVMPGYKYDTIWGFGMSGLAIRDMNNWSEEYRFYRKYNASPVSMPSVGSPKLYDEEVEILDTFSNHYKVRHGQKVFDVSKEYFELMRNTMHNSRLSTSKADLTFKSPILAPCCIGAHVAYSNYDSDVRRLFLSARTVDIQKAASEVSYTLKTFDP
jgi:hypothetical protein